MSTSPNVVGGRPPVQDLVALVDAPHEFPYLTERFLRRLVHERRIPVWHVGRRVYLARDDLVAIPQETPAVRGGRA